VLRTRPVLRTFTLRPPPAQGRAYVFEIITNCSKSDERFGTVLEPNVFSSPINVRKVLLLGSDNCLHLRAVNETAACLRTSYYCMGHSTYGIFESTVANRQRRTAIFRAQSSQIKRLGEINDCAQSRVLPRRRAVCAVDNYVSHSSYNCSLDLGGGE